MLFVFFQILSFSLSGDQQDNDCAAYNVSLHVSSLCLPGIAQDPQCESGKFKFPPFVSFPFMLHLRLRILVCGLGCIFAYVWVGCTGALDVRRKGTTPHN